MQTAKRIQDVLGQAGICVWNGYREKEICLLNFHGGYARLWRRPREPKENIRLGGDNSFSWCHPIVEPCAEAKEIAIRAIVRELARSTPDDLECGLDVSGRLKNRE